jgi:Mg2+ and Co2+ transporter CorA
MYQARAIHVQSQRLEILGSLTILSLRSIWPKIEESDTGQSRSKIAKNEEKMNTSVRKSTTNKKADSKKELRKVVNLLLPEGLMIFLAVLMIPIIIVPLFADLSDSVSSFLALLDNTILAIFILEYLLKAFLAQNIGKHVINPWHLLDLLIILIALVTLLPMVSTRFARSSLLLRLLRIIRIVAVGGRAVDRRSKLESSETKVEAVKEEMAIQVVDGSLGNVINKVPFEQLENYIHNPAQTWVNLTSVSEDDFGRLYQTLGIPEIILASELVDDSYPHMDYFEHYSIIFARIADVEIFTGEAASLKVSRSGLVIVCQGRNIITMSRNHSDSFERILDKARKIHHQEEPLAVTVLYTILKYILERDKQIIAALEQELIAIENTPLKERPDNFLETTFYLRKEVNQLVPALLHLKEIITSITSRRVPLEGFNEQYENIFDTLNDEAGYLHETASNARDALLSLIDLYINTTSYETNKVMRTIAVITSLGIIPALMGLLGSNIAGNPWDIQLWQVFSLLGVIMLFMGWIFYRLGWLKG